MDVATNRKQHIANVEHILFFCHVANKKKIFNTYFKIFT